MDNHSHRIACVLGLITICCGGEKDTAPPTDGNTPPEVYITSHADGASAFDQQEVDMAGLVSDSEDDTEALRVSWALGGTTACRITIDYNGSREVSLTVKDTLGSSSLARISFDIIDSEPPSIEVLEPISGEAYSESTPVRFLAEVADPDNDPSQLEVVWDSNIQGELPVSAPDPSGVIDSMVVLEEGDHRIQVAVSDPEGYITEETLFIAVGP